MKFHLTLGVPRVCAWVAQHNILNQTKLTKGEELFPKPSISQNRRFRTESNIVITRPQFPAFQFAVYISYFL